MKNIKTIVILKFAFYLTACTEWKHWDNFHMQVKICNYCTYKTESFVHYQLLQLNSYFSFKGKWK